MKSTGIVRKIDDLGRMVIPMELRKTMDLDKKEPIEIFVDDDKVILQKYHPGCIFCGEAEDVFEFQGKMICNECKESLCENN